MPRSVKIDTALLLFLVVSWSMASPRLGPLMDFLAGVMAGLTLVGIVQDLVKYALARDQQKL